MIKKYVIFLLWIPILVVTCKKSDFVEVEFTQYNVPYNNFDGDSAECSTSYYDRWRDLDIRSEKVFLDVLFPCDSAGLISSGIDFEKNSILMSFIFNNHVYYDYTIIRKIYKSDELKLFRYHIIIKGSQCTYSECLLMDETYLLLEKIPDDYFVEFIYEDKTKRTIIN